MHGEGRTRVGDDVLEATLVHGNHVGIALDHIDTILLRDGLLRLIESVEFTFLMIDLRVGRVHVFLLHALRPGVQQASSESHHLTTDVQPREDYTTSVAVAQRVLAIAQPCLNQKLRLVSCLLGCSGQGVTLRQGEAEVELRNDIVADATTTEILLTDGDAVGIVLQDILEVFHSPLVDDEHRLTVALLLLLLVGEFLLLYLDIVFLCQPAQGLRIGNLLVLHQEVNGRATLATGETLADLLRRRHHERRSLIVVERTEAFIVHACLPQRHELPHHVDNVRGVHDLIYRQPVNHLFTLSPFHLYLRFHKYEIDGCYETEGRSSMVPVQLFVLEDEVRNHGKHHQRDTLLNDLQLYEVERSAVVHKT